MEKTVIKNVGVAITGSFCTHDKILNEIVLLVKKGYNVLPIISDSVKSTDTRFGKANDFILKLKEITGNDVIDNIVKAEPIGPKNLIDILLIAPCTGNTLSKLANAITDNAVLMTAKAHLRNNKPLVVGISSNDNLGLNFNNLAKLVNSKNVYFVPFSQDDPINKPKSLICNWSLIEKTLLSANEGIQLQPLFLK
ncbi:MAG: dipicolinate synthase subunit B [Clostridiales bacterium]|nr:dipicolinate synthase subunit B [Clostridiales bacterium]